MRAKVKDDSRWGVVTACGGLEFVRGEWRNVPAHAEGEAQRNPYLEIEAPEPPIVVIDTTDGIQPTEAAQAGGILSKFRKAKK